MTLDFSIGKLEYTQEEGEEPWPHAVWDKPLPETDGCDQTRAYANKPTRMISWLAVDTMFYYIPPIKQALLDAEWNGSNDPCVVPITPELIAALKRLPEPPAYNADRLRWFIFWMELARTHYGDAAVMVNS